jgi:hypothetical protein
MSAPLEVHHWCDFCRRDGGTFSYQLEAFVCFTCIDRETAKLYPKEPSNPKEPSSSTPLLTANGSKAFDSSQAVDGSLGVRRDETAARMRALKIKARPWESFRCVLPEHDDQARVVPGNPPRYECSVSIGLAEVRAAVAYGTVRKIKPLEAARWRDLVDYEAGLRSPDLVNVSIPDGASETTIKVARAMQLLVSLRDDRWDTPAFTFAREFAMAYTGVTSDQVRDAMEWLEKKHVIVRQEDRLPNRPILWKLGDSSTGGRS